MRQLRTLGTTLARGGALAWLLGPLLLLAACTTSTERAARGAVHATALGAGAAALSVEDLRWLNRITFGLDTASLQRYRELGRERFLAQQLSPANATLPSAIAAQIAALQLERNDPATVLPEIAAENQRVDAMGEGPEREQARKARNERANKVASDTIRRQLLRAVYSPAQLQEQLVWFWLNHFNVHQYKGNVRWLLADYEDRAIRPHALGSFRDLVLATLQHPAMLQYLDNAQNAVGHVNENYARELMELHTLGVGAGYTQRDVQELARVLTGAGINSSGVTPHLRRDLESLYVRRGAFEFNPARHDFGAKTLLGTPIAARGWPEIEQAVTLLVHQPACARFITRKLAVYFVGDAPPPALLARLAVSFERSDGNIAEVLRTLFHSPEFLASLGGQFKDPRQFILSAVRFAYDGQEILNSRPMMNWLNALGEAPYARITPDGYATGELAWASSGQLSRRFEIARAIGAGNAGLFDPEDGSAAAATGFPRLASRLYFEGVEPYLSARTQGVLARASSQAEWNTLLLSAPEWNYR